MKGNSRLRDLFFWSALLIFVATVYLIPAAYYRWLNFRFLIGPEPFHHWLSWTGTAFIAFFTPSYAFLKRRYPKRLKTLLGIHVLGNLVSFMFVSVHLAHQLGRPRSSTRSSGRG